MQETISGNASLEVTDDFYVFRIPRTQGVTLPEAPVDATKEKLVVVGHMGEVLRAAVKQKKEWFFHRDLRADVADALASQLAKLVSQLTKLGVLQVRRAPVPNGRFKQWRLTEFGFGVADISGAITPPIFLDEHGRPEKPEVCFNRVIALCYWAYLHGGILKPTWVFPFINRTLDLSTFHGYFSTMANPDKGKYHRFGKLEMKPYPMLYILLDDKGTSLLAEHPDMVRVFEKAGWKYPTEDDVRASLQIRHEENEACFAKIMQLKAAA